jgi:hypothetical protein
LRAFLVEDGAAFDRGIDDRALLHEQLAFAQQRADFRKEALGQRVRFEQVAELQQGLARPPASLFPSASSVVASGTASTLRSIPAKSLP